MTTIIAFVEFALGFVPFVVVVLATLTTLWAATKLFPSFGEWARDSFEGLFGVDENYDEKYETGYAIHSNRW